MTINNLIYLGQTVDLDTTENGIWAIRSENSGAIVNQSFSNSIKLVSVDLADGGDGFISDQNEQWFFNPNEPVTYNTGAGGVTTNVDGTIYVSVTLTLSDGTTRANVWATVLQMNNGDTFLGNYYCSSTLNNLAIAGVKVDCILNDSLTGYYTGWGIMNTTVSRPVDGTAGADFMSVGYTDAQGDQIDGTDGLSDIIYANGGDDTVFGGSANDTIFGGDGADSLNGGAGNDSLVGGNGDDTLTGGAGADTFVGGTGLDVVDYSTNSTAVNVNLPSNSVTGGGDAAGDVIDGTIDGVIGSAFNDTLTGDDGENYGGGDSYTSLILGNGGDDIIDGRVGSDSLYGGAGRDTISGGAGDDLIDGGTDDDALTGGAGNDAIFGGDGADNANGGQGNDFIAGGAGADTLSGAGGSDTIDGGDGADVILGGTSSGTFQTGLTLWANDNCANLYRIDVDAAGQGTRVLVGQTGVVFVDIAMGADGRLFGVTGNCLYRINTTTGASTFVGYMGNGVNGAALSFGADGLLYNSNGSTIYRFNPDTPSATTAFWTNPAGGVPAGDFLTVGDKMFVSWCAPNGATQLLQLSIGNTGAVASSVVLGQLPNLTYGLALGPDGSIYASSNNSIFKLMLPTAPITGTIPSTLVSGSTIGNVYYGATSNTETSLTDGVDGADLLSGGAGNDSIYGMAGNDTLAGGDGDDYLQGDDLTAVAPPAATTGTARIVIDGTAGAYNGALLVQVTSATGQVTTQTLTGSYDASIGVVYNVALTGGDTIRVGITSPEGTFWSNTANAVVNQSNFEWARISFEDTASLGDRDFDDVRVDVTLSGNVNLLLPNSGAINPGAGASASTTVPAAGFNDLLSGGAGNDTMLGGGGADTLSGGLGADRAEGGAGDDDIAVGGADLAFGGTGDDEFTLDATDTGADFAATIDGGTDGTTGAADGTENGNAGDVLNMSSGTTSQTVTFGANAQSGGVNGLDGDAGVDITFSAMERIITGAGADLVTGGGAGGRANVDTGAGNDRVVQVYTPGTGAVDTYNGNVGTDTFVLAFTAAQWATAAVQADVAAYVAHLAGGNASLPFTFSTVNTTVTNFEVFEVTVNGVTLNPANAGVTANGDDILATEDGPASITVNLLANDVVPDRAANVQLLSSTSAYGTLSLTTSLLTTVQTAALVFTPNNGLLQSLPAGQTLTETLTYRVTDVDGSVGDATVTITITGTNDLASITGVANGSTTEDALAAITGSLTVTDVDAGEARFQTPASLSGTYGSFTFNPATGAWAYTPSASAAALQSLAVGQQVTDSLTVTSADGTASQTITVSITGQNDAPTLTAGVLAAEEDGPSVTLNLATLGDDIDSDDNGASLTYTITGAPSVGSASISGTTLTYNGGAGLDTLAAGETRSTVITVTADDGNGGSVSSNVTVTITGTNDAPTLTAGVLAAAEDGPSVTLNLASLGDDIDSDDNGASLTYTITGAPSVGSATISGTTLTYNGGAGLDALAAGETRSTVITVTADDGNGGSVSSNVTVTITGTNDAPTLTAGVLAAEEDGPSVTLNLATLGDDIDSDDNGASLTYTITGAPAIGTASIAGTTLTYNGGAGLDALAAGETRSTVITVTADDGNGGSVSSNVTVTITGTNDAPTLTAGVLAAEEDGPSVTLNLATLGDDIDSDDNGASLTYTITGAPSVGSASISGTTLTYNGGAGLDTLAAGETRSTVITVTADDGNGGSVSSNVTVTITGTNDAPTVAAALTAVATEGDTMLQTIDLLAGASDLDNGETATLTIANVTGLADGITLVGTSLVVDPSAPGFDFIPEGQTRDFTITYDVVDVQGASVSQTATITVIGTNDAPVTADIFVAVNEGDGLVTIDLLAGATDPDEGETATLTVTPYTGLIPVPQGASFVGNSLVVDTSDPAFDYLAEGETGQLAALYSVRDVNGAAGNGGLNGVVVTLTGTNDAPTLAAGALAAVEDDTSVTLDLASIGDDIDSDDDGSTLTYTITGAPDLGTASIAGSTLTYANAAGLDSLAAGEQLTTVVTVTATDRHGASVSSNVTVTITGTNDAPTLTAGVLAAEEDGPSVTLNLATLGDDIDSDDNGASLTYTITGAPAIGTATLSGTTLTYDAGPGLDYLSAGESVTQDIEITAVDSHGAVVTSVVAVTINGTNDAPVAVAGPAPDPIVSVIGRTMTATGTVSFTDPDFNDTHFGSGVDPFGVGLNFVETGSAQNGGIGEWTWTITIDLDIAPPGTNLQFDWLLSDASGAAIFDTVAFTVPSVGNTPPVITGPITFASILGDGLTQFSVTDYYLDDQGDPLTALPIPTQQYPGITFTGTDIFELNSDNPAYQFLTAGQTQTFTYAYLVSDGTDSSVATVEWTITGTRIGVIGTAGADDLIGTDFQAELINGGAGDDTMTGGAGEDVFAYLAAGDGFDLITDFGQGEDRIGVSASAFGGNLVPGEAPTVLTVADYTTADSGGTDGVFILQTDGTDGTLYWDADGGLGDNATAIAQLTGISNLTQDDFFLFI